MGTVTPYKGTVPLVCRDAIPEEVLQETGKTRETIEFYKLVDGSHRNAQR